MLYPYGHFSVRCVFRILESGGPTVECQRREGRLTAVSADGGGCGAPSPENFLIFWMKMACSDALWNTVLKFMCLQQNALHQTSMHRACRFFVKVGVPRDAASLNTPLYATGGTDRRTSCNSASFQRTHRVLIRHAVNTQQSGHERQ